MTFASEGYPYMLGAAALAVIAFMLALKVRSWPLWVVAFLLLVAMLSAAWVFRAPAHALASHRALTGAPLTPVTA